MKEIKYRKEFYAFLKEKGVYNDYMTNFKRESILATEERWCTRDEIDIRSFLSANMLIGWITMAFSWSKTKEFNKWNTIDDEWRLYIKTLINHENKTYVASTANTSDAIIANKD